MKERFPSVPSEPGEVQEERNEESGILGKFRKKGKLLTGAMALSSLLAASNEVKAAPPQAKIEEQAVNKEKLKVAALKLFEDAFEAESRPGEGDRDKEMVVGVAIDTFALNLKLGFSESAYISGTILPHERDAALRLLARYKDAFIEAKFGDRNGKVAPAERAKFEAAVKEHAGLRFLLKRIEEVK